MDILKRQYQRLLRSTDTTHIRELYHRISWHARLIGIKGARGVGKTTMMLQRIKLTFPDISKALYVSLDDVWFASHRLTELGEIAEQEDITHLFIDEVHRLPGWERHIKNLYDFFPDLHIVFTGSSLLEIDNSIADLSRRCLMYNLRGLSFREFLDFQGFQFEAVSLSDILYNHQKIALDVIGKIDVMGQFKKYLCHGFFPFYTTETETDYLLRVNNMVSTVIDYDIPAVENVEYATLLKAKHLLSIIASQTPSPLNARITAGLLGVTVNQLIKILSLLERSQILRLLYYQAERNPKSMAKPQKVIFDNPSIIYALGYGDKGKIRETFLASMISSSHEVAYPKAGDLLVDNRYLFEVGGVNKGFNQIKDMPDSFVAADDIEQGFGNRIPLWLFGFLY
ncbi:MAG: AAA family ATPase [Muribaculaceae bacterium]|nr:AAA family ATPase [Muribaculaceae bacterium]